MLTIDHIKEKYNSEIALVILMVRVYLKKATVRDFNEFVDKNIIDWDFFYKLTAAHEIRPFIHKVIAENGLFIDENIIVKLRSDSLRLAAINFEQLAELTRLQKLFADKNIEIVPYKGSILSQHLFGDFVTRETCDIDLLIKVEDFVRIKEILFLEGYSSNYFYNEEYKKVLFLTSTEYQFYKEGKNAKIAIEVHWSLIGKMQDVPLLNNTLFNKRQAELILGTEMKCLNKETEMLTMIVHHGVNDVWRTLKHVLDFAVALQCYSDDVNWTNFYDTAERYKIANATRVGMTLSKEIFGVEAPTARIADKEILKNVLDNLLSYPLIGKHKLRIVNFRQQLSLRDNFKDRLLLCWNYFKAGVTPNIRDIESYYLPRKYFFLYYLIKPFRMIRKR